MKTTLKVTAVFLAFCAIANAVQWVALSIPQWLCAVILVVGIPAAVCALLAGLAKASK